jgi:hypothetical protein
MSKMTENFCSKCDNAGIYPFHSQPIWVHNLVGRYALLR